MKTSGGLSSAGAPLWYRQRGGEKEQSSPFHSPVHDESWRCAKVLSTQGVVILGRWLPCSTCSYGTQADGMKHMVRTSEESST